MFPTFISILDIQSWWEVPSIAHFCKVFRSAFNLLDFDIEDLEEALLTDGTEDPSWLPELIVQLLSGCSRNNDISTFNYQMFLRRLFRQKCQDSDQYNPFNTDIDFQLLPLRTKVDILYSLCDFRLDADDAEDALKHFEGDSLRVKPIGRDSNDSAYWYFHGTRLYREDFPNRSKKAEKAIWQVICFTEEDWVQLSKKLKASSNKAEKELYNTLAEDFLPYVPKWFKEKERQARRRLLENLPRRTSSRIKEKESLIEVPLVEAPKPVVLNKEEEEQLKKKKLQEQRQEAYERRARLKEQSGEESNSDLSESRYEMAGAKTRNKKGKVRTRKQSQSSTSSRDYSSVSASSRNCSTSRNNSGSDNKKNAVSAITGLPSVGRQTNNSLACATGQILIQPVVTTNKKKLKTSQVFRQTDEDLQVGMHKILDHIKNHEDAWPFADPVEEEFAPNYYSVIRKPMDLQKMEERLDSGHYKTFSKFKADFQLIVDNCRLYNGATNEYTGMVDNLLQVFEKATEKFLDPSSSSDEEVAIVYSAQGNEVKTNKRKRLEVINPPNKKPCKPEKKLDYSSDESDKSDKKEKAPKKEQPKKVAPVAKKSKKPMYEESPPSPPPLKTTKNKSKSKNQKQNEKLKSEKKVAKKQGRPPKKKPRRSVSQSPTRSRSRSRHKSMSSSPSRSNWSSSPPPSWPPSPENKFDFSPKVNNKKNFCDNFDTTDKDSDDKWNDILKDTFHNPLEKNTSRERSPPKHKDKHNKLRETIEKLKAKSEITNKLKEKEFHKDVENEKSKENKEISKDTPSAKNKEPSKKIKQKQPTGKGVKETHNDTHNSLSKTDKSTNSLGKDADGIKYEQLSLVSEETLKEISMWLDSPQKFSDSNTVSSSPSYNFTEDVDSNKSDDFKKKIEKTALIKKENGKDPKKKPFQRDPSKLFRRREVQRTIDRLQPGKSKGNLISNIQSTTKTDDLHPLGPLSKVKDTKNSLIVKTNDSAPKLSLGTVLNSFGKHKFEDNDPKIDDDKKEDVIGVKDEEKVEDVVDTDKSVSKEKIVELKVSEKVETKTESSTLVLDSVPGEPTPNLSAWFKAFGAPKVQPNSKKSDVKIESKDEKEDTECKAPEVRKISVPDPSPNNPDSPIMPHGQPATRQRKISTGSSMSERSSFSQDMDSPHVGIDERLGAYPAPYPSPMHRSPSGASPVMASPRPDVSPKTYSAFNGQIRVGFYQDTVSTKSSPDKSCSPRDNPQSPYPQYSEHVYTPSTTAQNSNNYSYGGNSYYSPSPTPNYTLPNRTPPYNNEQNGPAYYEANKAQPEELNPKSISYQTSPVNSVNMQTTNVDNYQDPMRIGDKNAVFPVKKRAYNELEPVPNMPPMYEQPKLQQQQDQYENRPSNVEMNIVEERSPQSANMQVVSPKQYVHQNIPEPKPSINTNDQVSVNLNKTEPQTQTENDLNSLRNMNYPNLYNYPNTNTSYPISVPSARPLETERKIDMSKYTNMGYSGPDVSFSRSLPYPNAEANYVRTSAGSTQQTQQLTNNTSGRYTESNMTMDMDTFKTMNMNPAMNQQSSPHENMAQNTANLQQHARLPQQQLEGNNAYKPSVNIPRPSYSAPSMEMDQSLGLRGNIANLSHIVDRFPSDERMLQGLQQSTPSYYGDKNLGPAHMFPKSIATSASGLSIFSQPNVTLPYNHSIQPTPSSVYSRQMNEINQSLMNQEKTQLNVPQPQPDRKTKRKKANKTATPPVSSMDNTVSNTSNQGFQSYLKNPSTQIEPNPISLKTASVVPGSAFNFGPTPTGLGLPSGLYGEKDGFNFLDDFRSAGPNYYMAAAAAHHRPAQDTADKQVRAAHQPSGPPTTGYPFIGGPQSRPPGYPLGGPFMPTHQAPLMDTSSPLYQQYLQAGVLHQGLLGPTATYPPGYHAALSMRQPYDTMTRPHWL